MARRRAVTLALAVLLLLGSCTAGDAAHDQAARSRHPVSAAGDHPSTSPSMRSKPAALASPSPSPSPSPPPPPPPLPPLLGHGDLRGPYGSMYHTGSSAVALTFDDGPGPDTGRVLDTLKQYGVHATFCVIGSQVSAQASMIKRIVREGHTLCNHTWSHDEKLSTRTPAQIVAELQRTDDAIHAIVPGARIQYFRNPGGEFSPQTVSIAAGMGMRSLYWSVDPADWSRPGTQAIISNVIDHTRPGSIVLMHDGGGDRSQTLAALRTLLPYLKHKYGLIPLPTSANASR
ncbi:hypothetical protein GCM10023322_01630 [Rugosimonospora acidiphila]|uniref:NodB homology domain-containing protein n=1 Tax=Rugosimonospora acidiphila TaxID=556531 RepID=A0ABP9RHI5_9ACTN